MINLLKIVAQVIPDNDINVPRIRNPGSGQVQDILQVVFMILGVISVIMVVIGGLMYVLSSGDPQRTAKAKDTILYALIGLAIAVMSSAIVYFIIGKI